MHASTYVGIYTYIHKHTHVWYCGARIFHRTVSIARFVGTDKGRAVCQRRTHRGKHVPTSPFPWNIKRDRRTDVRSIQSENGSQPEDGVGSQGPRKLKITYRWGHHMQGSTAQGRPQQREWIMPTIHRAASALCIHTARHPQRRARRRDIGREAKIVQA